MNENRLLTGTRLGKYMIQGLIGRGRKTEVYRATRPDLKRQVAIKIFRPTLPRSPELAACFQRDMQAIAALKHPNILRIFEVGIDKDTLFAVMELVEGPTLRDLLSTRRTGLQREQALRFFNQIASAAAYAHDQKIVHGNLKPDNILLDAAQRPVLVDFEIPCLRESGLPDTGSTPAYRAPEQASQNVTLPQSDIYALGIMLYEMVTGDVPFKGDTRESVIAQHINTEPTPPSKIAVDLHPRIEKVILKALRKKPEERYATAREMLADLEREDGDDQYETLNLERGSKPEVRRSQSEIVRFNITRTDEPYEELDSPPTQKRLILLAVSMVAILVLVLVLAALLLAS